MTETTRSRAPLDGVRVVELATWGFVPIAASVLAEWGADVIKIEHPQTADPMRALSVSGGVLPVVEGSNFMWDLHNRGKRSVGIDLAHLEGQEVLARLVERADVFVTSFLRPARERLRIDVADIHAINPHVIYGRGSGAGPEGPEADRGGFDIAMFWARSGAMFKASDTERGLLAGMPSAAFGDVLSGLTLAGGIAAALGGDGTKAGTVVDVSLLAVGMWAMRNEIAGCLLADCDKFYRPADRSFVPNPISAPYRTSDGRIIQLTMLEADRHWPDLCSLIDRNDLIEDPRFRTEQDRRMNSDACVAELEKVFASDTLDHWRRRLASATGVWAVAQTPRELAHDPQVLANSYLINTTDIHGQELPTVPCPVRFDGQQMLGAPAPEWGADTESVMLELGYDWANMATLKSSGAIL